MPAPKPSISTTLTGQRIAIDEADQQAEWSTNHRLNGYSWIHFVCRGNTGEKLSGNTYNQPSEERRLNLGGVPSLSFELSGGRQITKADGTQGRSVHPANVAYWWLREKGATAEQLGSFTEAAALPRFAATTDNATRLIRRYEFNGVLLANQSTPELLAIIEFMMAGSFVFAQGKLHLRPRELASTTTTVPADDVYEYQLRPLSGPPYNRAFMQLAECPGAQALALDCALPIVQNNALRTADGLVLLERLKPASFIRDYYQGQWRLRLYAQQLAYRRGAVCRVRATNARRALLVGDRAELTLPEGTIAGHLTRATDLLDGSLAWQISVGPALLFGAEAETDYAGRFAPGAGLLLDDVEPPADPAGVVVANIATGYAVAYALPAEEDYDFTQIRDRLDGDTADEAEIFRDLTQGAFQRTGLTTAEVHYVSIRHVDTSGNGSVWSPEQTVTVRATEQVESLFDVPADSIDIEVNTQLDPVHVLPEGTIPSTFTSTSQTVDLEAFSNIAWAGSVALNADLIDGGGPAFLREIRQTLGGLTEIRLSAEADGTPADAGPDFIASLETARSFMTLTEASAGTIVMQGPNRSGNTTRDSTEPYRWGPPTAEATALNTWLNALGSGAVTCTIGPPDNEALTYSTEGTLPDGLAVDTATREVSGTPTQVGFYSFIWEATLGSTVSRIPIYVSVRPTGVLALTFAQGDIRIGVQTGSDSIDPSNPQLPEATGADNITYTSPGKPSWLTIDADRRVTITAGESVPAATHPLQHSFRWVATDDDGNATEASQPITVFIAPAEAVAVLAFAQGDTNINVQVGETTTLPASPQLPQATGGTAPYTYTTSGKPSWLDIDGDRRVTLNAAPTELDGVFQKFTWIAEDSEGVTGEIEITIGIEPAEVEAEAVLTFAQGDEEIEVQVGETTTTPSSPQLPQATGGTAPYTYTSPGKPSWLTIDSNRRVTVTGTITELDGRLVGFDWVAEDSEGIEGRRRILVNILPVDPPDPLTFAQGDREIEVQVGETTTNPSSPQLPQAVGTQSDITYTSPGKPTWLTIDSDRRVTVTDTITELDGIVVGFDWTATHTDGRTVAERIIINIKQDVPILPLTFTQGNREINVQVGETTTDPASPQLPQAVGTQSDITYTTEGKPSWIDIDSDRRVTVTGAITALDGRLVGFDWTATHTDGRTVAERIIINIESAKPIQREQECYWLGPDTNPFLIYTADETDVQRTNESFLPTISGRICTTEPGETTSTLPALYLLARTYSDNPDFATSWRVRRVIDEYVAAVVEVPEFPTEIEIARFTQPTDLTLTLEAATISSGTLVYAIVGTLPTGITFNPLTRELTADGSEILQDITHHTYRASVSGDASRKTEKSLIIYVLPPPTSFSGQEDEEL